MGNTRRNSSITGVDWKQINTVTRALARSLRKLCMITSQSTSLKSMIEAKYAMPPSTRLQSPQMGILNEKETDSALLIQGYSGKSNS